MADLNKPDKQRGFTLLEILITIGLMVVTIIAISKLYQTYLRLTAEEKFKITAASLANQKIETIRNLPYNLIGTLGGIPAGNIPQIETVIKNGIPFTVTTNILYIDDPFDGTLIPGEIDNPYQINNDEVIFYWNMESNSSSQSPQKGSGLITVSSNVTVAGGVENNGLEFAPDADMDYARADVSTNLDPARGRIAFWYKAINKTISSTHSLVNVTGCNGELYLDRLNSNKLKLSYGQPPALEYFSTHPLIWDEDKWYFIEIMFDSDNDIIAVFRDNEEVGYLGSSSVDPPTSCDYIYFGNSGASAQQTADGIIDEIYILNNPDPSSYPQDLLNTDYKRVKITVSWDTPYGQKNIYLITDIAPPGIETTAGGGTLIINVFDANGLPVPQADISILNSLVDPNIDLALTTNNEGRLVLPGVPTGSTYHVTSTKTGYSIDQTYEATIDYPNPLRPPISIIEGQTTEVSFSIDRTSQLNIKTVSRSLPGNWQVNSLPTSTDHFSSRLTASDNNFYYVWEDYRDGITPSTYSQSFSTLGIKQWPNDIDVSNHTNQISPDITIDDSANTYIVWSDDTSGNKDIYISKLSSAGANIWGTEKKVNADTGNTNQTKASLIYNSGKIYVVWQDDRTDQGDIYFNSLDTNGNRLLTNDVKINTDLANSVQSSPEIIADNNNNLSVAWLDNRSGQYHIYLTKIDEQGNLLWPSEQKVNSENPVVNHDNFSLAITSQDDIFLTWSDTRLLQHNIWWQQFASSSQKIYLNDQELNVQAPTAQQLDPQIAISTNDEIYIAWQDNRNVDHDIFLTKMDGSGGLLWPQEIQLNLEFSGDQEIGDMAIYQTDKVVVSWTDYDEANGNIWTAAVTSGVDETPVPYVDFKLQSSKLIFSDPDKLKFENSYTTNAQGELSISPLEWDTYNLAITGPIYSLGSSDPEIPFFIAPATTTNLTIVVE